MASLRLTHPSVAAWLPRTRGAYSLGTLLVLVLGLLWGTWNRDLVNGDSADYFRRAAVWLKAGPAPIPLFISYSPLYILYFAGCEWLWPNPAAAFFFHRLVIVLGGAAAFYVLLRRILPRPWAWWVAAWWIVLPTTARAEFEVHYFAFAFLALAGALAGGRSDWCRGGALAVLSLLAVFLRNEYLPAVGLFALCCLGSTWSAPGWAVRARAAIALLLPSALTLMAIGWLISGGRDAHPWRQYFSGLERRHRANLTQVYPLGYLQRHDDWKGDPWSGGSELMLRDFGSPHPTFGEAWQANPRAMMEHVTWNLRLVPAGLQLGLLACFGQSPPPDFGGGGAERIRNPWPLSALLVALWVGGGWMLLRFWHRHHRIFRPHAAACWVWLFLACCLPTAIISIVTQRPRPNYIFPLLMLLMAFTGLAGRLLWPHVRRIGIPLFFRRSLAPVAVGVLIVTCSGRNSPAFIYRPNVEHWEHLQPFQHLLARKGGILCTNVAKPIELACFNGLDWANRHTVQPWSVVLAALNQGKSFDQILAESGATEIYFLEPEKLPGGIGSWRKETADHGEWEKMGEVSYGMRPWEFWAREIKKKSPL